MRYKFLSQEQKDAMEALNSASQEYSRECKVLYNLRQTLPSEFKRTTEQQAAWLTQRFIVSQTCKNKEAKAQEYYSLMNINHGFTMAKTAEKILEAARELQSRKDFEESLKAQEILEQEQQKLQATAKDPKAQALLKKLMEQMGLSQPEASNEQEANS
jgi:hypothetical protein